MSEGASPSRLSVEAADKVPAKASASASATALGGKGGKVKGRNVFKVAGAIIGFMIGAGFATGQETLQYYTSEGFWGIGGVLVAYAFVFWLFYCFMVTGSRTGLRHSRDVFQYYCGKHLGWVYEILTVSMLILVSVTMVASVGSIVSQYFGIPEVVGRAIITVLVVLSVLLGLRKLLDILGPLGPIIVIGLIVISAAALFSNPGGLADVNEFIANADPPMLKASGFWLLSGILYGIMNIYPLASFGSAMGADSTSKKEAVIGALIGSVALAVGAGFLALSQLSNLGIVYGQDIPTLALAAEYLPFITSVFSIILLLGIYTTVTPNLWAVAQAFGKDRSKKYVIATVVSGIAVFGISFLPYGELMNMIYPFAGYAAYLMIFCMVLKHVRLFIEKRRAPKAADAGTRE